MRGARAAACSFVLAAMGVARGTLSLDAGGGATTGYTRRFAARVAYDGTDFRGWQVQAATNDRSRPPRTVQGELEAALNTVYQQQVRTVAASRTDTGVHARSQTIHFDVTGRDGGEVSGGACGIASRGVASATPPRRYFHRHCRLCSYRSHERQNLHRRDRRHRRRRRNRRRHHQPRYVDELGLLEYKLNQLLPSDAVVWNVSRAPVLGTVNGMPWHANVATTGKIYSYRWRCASFMDPLERRYRAHWYKEPMDLERLEQGIRLFEVVQWRLVLATA
mmetsp:Transcript_43067/g.116201  ORF Transcript_43067/g.116201 Transcript_43067/m.116201 type:complete len:277 (-) Transcript_43067:35-865(-)